MADANFEGKNGSEFKEAVCIDAGRVFDSCCDRDCLEDLRVYFCEEGQALIAEATNIKVKSAEVVDVTIDVSPVNLSHGFYSIDLTFYFIVDVDISNGPCGCPNDIKGIAIFNKTVVLCGGEGNVRTFSSDDAEESAELCCCRGNVSPTATVQVACPIPLTSRIGPATTVTDNLATIPPCVLNFLGGCELSAPTEGNVAYVTLGIFTIVQLVRKVQMLVPVYDFCIPEKQCEFTADTPCEVFRRIDFPTSAFFPASCPKSGCGCEERKD
jgi:hypothetical protein